MQVFNWVVLAWNWQKGASSSTVNLHPPAPVHAPTDSSTQDTNKRARSAEVTSLKAVCNDDVWWFWADIWELGLLDAWSSEAWPVSLVWSLFGAFLYWNSSFSLLFFHLVQMMPFLSCKWCIFLWQQELSQTEAKVQRLVELGFDRRTVIQALTLFNGNEEQAASYLFGGF